MTGFSVPAGRHGRSVAAAAAWVLVPSLAFAQTLDIIQPYGNEAGCRVAKGEEKAGAEALIMRNDRFESAALVCEFVQVLKAADGTKVITALCDIEDEDGRSVNLFTVAPGRTDPTALQIRDEYGAPWDEVKPCQ
ncbi:MAG: hypothetical protein F9K19_26305 [Rhizobiaceae bacterium]|nr:MAG: hypothetical protein F9K19_26305 [Rhizobiaceae bacterium]CAG0985564.1 hypothetical protein RHIZO_01972 [Rhizobiaceae bacterium]